MSQEDVYARLSAEFEETFTDVRGGVSLTYITGEQVISRLNEVLSVAGWSFEVKEHGLNAEADEFWTLGKLTVFIDGLCVAREQFGSQKVKRSRSSGTPLDIGFDEKGSATDALKKCATLIGVGLYLSKKEQPVGPPSNGQDQPGRNAGIPAANQDPGQARPSASTQAVSAEPTSSSTTTTPAPGPTFRPPQSGTIAEQMAARGLGPPVEEAGGPIACEACGEYLQTTNFRDGTSWLPEKLAYYGRQKFNQILCMECYKKAKAAKEQERQASVPF